MCGMCCVIVGPFERPSEAVLALSLADAALIHVSSANTSGIAVAEAAKRLGTPLLIVTTLSRAFEAAFPDAVLLKKPFQKTELKAVVDKLRTLVTTRSTQPRKAPC